MQAHMPLAKICLPLELSPCWAFDHGQVHCSYQSEADAQHHVCMIMVEFTFGRKTFSCLAAFVAPAGSSRKSADCLSALLELLPKVPDPQASSKSSSAPPDSELGWR